MKEASLMAAQLMAASMRTAPKAGGKDFLEIVVITDEKELGRIAKSMENYAADSSNEAYWHRDAANCSSCHALVLVGLKRFVTAGYDCGGCGFQLVQSFQAAAAS